MKTAGSAGYSLSRSRLCPLWLYRNGELVASAAAWDVSLIVERAPAKTSGRLTAEMILDPATIAEWLRLTSYAGRGRTLKPTIKASDNLRIVTQYEGKQWSIDAVQGNVRVVHQRGTPVVVHLDLLGNAPTQEKFDRKSDVRTVGPWCSTTLTTWCSTTLTIGGVKKVAKYVEFNFGAVVEYVYKAGRNFLIDVMQYVKTDVYIDPFVVPVDFDLEHDEGAATEIVFTAAGVTFYGKQLRPLNPPARFYGNNGDSASTHWRGGIEVKLCNPAATRRERKAA